MVEPVKAFNWNRVLIDICTQRDYLEPGAILQMKNLDTLVPNLKRVFEWAQRERVPIVSLVESHRPSEPSNGFPMHCVDGTAGQRKVDYTLLDPHIIVENDNYLSLPPDLQVKYRQVIFRKRTREILSNPKADRFLTQLDPDPFIIFGVGLERPIRSLALGLLARHKKVAVISDACGYWSAGDADLAARQIAAKHIQLISTDEITAPQPTKPFVRRGRRARQRRLRNQPSPARGSRARAGTK